MSIRRHQPKPQIAHLEPGPQPTHTMRPNSIIIGEFTITRLKEDRFIIEHVEGEMMETREARLIPLIERFWRKEF